jgi:hypothetical protein
VAAAQAHPGDEFFDMRGICLMLSDAADGAPRLEARSEGDPDALKQRVLDVLRRAIALAAPEPAVAAEAEAGIDWAAKAPDVEHMVHALWFAEGDYGDDGLATSEALRAAGRKPCKRCSVGELVASGVPPCCPRAAPAEQ